MNKRILAKPLAVALSATTFLSFAPVGNLTAMAATAQKATKVVKAGTTAAKYTVKVGKTKTLKAKVTFKKKVTLAKAKKSIKVSTSNKAAVAISKKAYSLNSKKTVCTVKVTVKAKAKGTAKIKVKAAKGTSAAKTGVTWKVTAKEDETPVVEDVAVTGVTLSNTTPKVGETINAVTTPENATNVASYAWYLADKADGTFTAIEGAASASLNITADMLGKFVKVTVTDADGKTFEAVATEAVANAEDVVVTKLEATGSKELTATLSKEAVVTAKDLVVKKGTVTLTPAEVVAEGTTVKITLGSKITKDTYSVAYGSTTPATVETEDEKLVELKTVGTALAQAQNDAITANGTTAIDADNTTVNAIIDYKALNQYGEPMNAEILSVTTTFGGATNFTEPTVKKDGKIYVYNIAAALGIAGTKGNVIIVSKNGVTTTNEVTMSEEAKVAKITLDGIYNTASGAFVDAVPAEKDASNYALVISPVDQYDRPITDKKMLYQTCSKAQVLTDMDIAGVVSNKLTADSFTEVEVNGKEKLAIKLTGAKVKAGSLQVIIVGDRFGSVFNETIKVEQIDLVKSFTYQAQGQIYNDYPNELEYSVTSVADKNITDYETLKKLITFDGTEMKWEKQTDGSAKLIYTPTGFSGSDAKNLRENTVKSVTAYANKDISAADQIVVPKTFTVYETKIPYSLVKYTGDIVGQEATLDILKAKFVVEDQYGNTMTAAKDGTNLTGMKLDYKYGDNATVSDATGSTLTFDIATTATKLNISVADMSNTNDAFDVNKAQLTLSLQRVNAQKATSITAVWDKKKTEGSGRNLDGAASTLDAYKFTVPAQYAKVEAQAKSSGITAGDFKLTGKVNGKTITIPAANYTIKTDSYVPITRAEAETAVKTATVTFTVTLLDESNKEYTEEVSCDYQYSAAPEKIVGFGSYSELDKDKPAALAYTPASSGEINAKDDMGLWFVAYDQYGDIVKDTISYTDHTMKITTNNGATPTLAVNLGEGTDAWTLTKNNTKSAYISEAVGTATFTVVATLENGLKATQKVLSTGGAYVPSTSTASVNFARLTGEKATGDVIATIDSASKVISGTTWKLQGSADNSTWSDVETLDLDGTSLKLLGDADITAGTYYQIVAVKASPSYSDKAYAMTDDKTANASITSAEATAPTQGDIDGSSDTSVALGSVQLKDQFGDDVAGASPVVTITSAKLGGLDVVLGDATLKTAGAGTNASPIVVTGTVGNSYTASIQQNDEVTYTVTQGGKTFTIKITKGSSDWSAAVTSGNPS